MNPLPLKKWFVYLKSRLTIRKKRLLRSLLAFGLGLAIALFIVEVVTVEVPVFGFHDIVNLNNSKELPPQRQEFPADYTQQNLESFLEYLAQKNYWFLSTQDLSDYFLSHPTKLIPSEHLKQQPIMITFDDGYKSVYTHLLPALEKIYNNYGKKIKVTLFVNSGFIGHHGTFLEHANCDDLREGFKKGFYDIQSHGLNHNDLTKLTAKQLDWELSQDQIRLRKCTQDLDTSHTVATHIAYPFGAVNKQVAEASSKYYFSGYLYNSRIFKIGWWKNNYRISRLTINQKKSVKDLIRLADGGWL